MIFLSKIQEFSKTVLFLLTLAFFTSSSSEIIDFYVTTTGFDTNSGLTSDNSFATLARALQAVDKTRDTLPLSTINIIIGKGVYNISEPLIFKGSANKTGPLILKAAIGDTAIISGGERIINWKRYDQKIWTTKIPEELKGWKFRQLYVNGILRQRARTPNSDFFHVVSSPDGGIEKGYKVKSCRFIFKPGDINPAWSGLNNAEIVIYNFWTDTHLRIKYIDTSNHIVTFTDSVKKTFSDDFSKNGAHYFVENVFELLDVPGEWFLDTIARNLYYYPLENEDVNSAEFIAPRAPVLISLDGDPQSKIFVENIQFKNISFMYSNYDLPDGMTNENQASSIIPGSIHLKGARNCSFDSCRIKSLGSYALEIADGCSNIKIRNCTFHDIAAGGIRINGSTLKNDSALRTGFNTIEHNIIYSYGQVFPSAAGILVMNSNDNRIAHNEIHHGYYSGISAGWVWGYGHSVSYNNIIEFNHIHHIGQGLLSDLGGIYTLGNSPGTVIQNNLIHDIDAHSYAGYGIYNDQGSANILIKNNIVYNTKSGGYYLHFGKKITLLNNIFAQGKDAQICLKSQGPLKGFVFKHNIIFWSKGKLFAAGFLKNSQMDLDSNLYYNPKKTAEQVTFGNMNCKEWYDEGNDLHSIFEEPKFLNEVNYSLDSLSPAFKIGFIPIDISKIGNFQSVFTEK